MKFTTKADTLRALAGRLSTAQVLPQISLTAGEARDNPARALELLREADLLNTHLIVRSSARNEDLSLIHISEPTRPY